MCSKIFPVTNHTCRASKTSFIFFWVILWLLCIFQFQQKYGLNIIAQKSYSNMTCNLSKLQIWDSRTHQNLFHEFWSCGSQDMDFWTFKPFSGNHFSEKQFESTPGPARCTQCSAPAIADERTRLPAGPAGQSAERGELQLERTGASSPPAMAERRRCSLSSRDVGPVERGWSAREHRGAKASTTR